METFTFNDVEYNLDSVSDTAKNLIADIQSTQAMKNAKVMEANAMVALEQRLTAELGAELETDMDAEVVEGD
jgi:hypothetical protein